MEMEGSKKKKAKPKGAMKPATPNAAISKPNQTELRIELDAILRRVDRLPVLDSRTPDEIIGYDQHGLPGPGVTPPGSCVPVRSPKGCVEDPDLEDWRKKFGREIPPAVKEFLDYRHRESEIGMKKNLRRRSRKNHAPTRRPEL